MREALQQAIEAMRTAYPHTKSTSDTSRERLSAAIASAEEALRRPERAVWWAAQEHSITNPKITNGGTFRSDLPTYAQMLAFTAAQADAFGHAAAEVEDGIECMGCTD